MKARVYAKNVSYIISVSLGKGCYRHLRISGKDTLEDLADAILQAFGFDKDHLYTFFMDDRWWSDHAPYNSPYSDEPPYTDSVKLSRFRFEKGQSFKFLFDYGDEWRFQCKVLRVLDEDTKQTEIVRTKGDSPKQYPDYVEYDEYDDESDEDDDIIEDESYEPSKRIVMTSYGNDKTADDSMELPESAKLPDELYDAAFVFRKDKLWNKLRDSDLFAVKFPDGETGFCTVMGMLGEYVSLALYIGDEGLWSLKHIAAPTDMNIRMVLIKQSCLQLNLVSRDEISDEAYMQAMDYAARNGVNFRGKNSYPVFESFKCFSMPESLTSEGDVAYLTTALKAAHNISEKLKKRSKTQLGLDDALGVIPLLTPEGDGFHWSLIKMPEAKLPAYLEPALSGDIAEKIAKMEKKGTLEFGVFFDPDFSVSDENTGRYVLPPAVVSAGSPAKLKNISVGNGYYPDISAELLKEFAERIISAGKCPKKIVTSGECSAMFIADLCEKCGIELSETDSIPKAEKLFVEHMREKILPDDEMMSDMYDMLLMLEELDEDSLRKMPQELLDSLGDAVGTGLLSEEFEKKLKKIIRS